MKHVTTIAALVFGLNFPFWNSALAFDGMAQDDAVAIHQVVQSQLDALSNDDAVGAFELASAEKQMLIGNPDNFLQLIKEQYSPIYRHQRVIFSQPEVLDGNAIQVVRITDHHSRVWLAIFWMQQEEDRTWKIDGCQLLETTSVSI